LLDPLLGHYQIEEISPFEKERRAMYRGGFMQIRKGGKTTSSHFEGASIGHQEGEGG
jgi:hypothetical protein